MKKPGCGVLAAFLIVFLILVALGSNEAVGYYFSHCQTEDIFDCLTGALQGDDEEEEEGSVAATGTYSYKGYDVTVTMHIPLEGGNVTGSVSGSCEGSVKGTFSGGNNGAISGKLFGTCDPFFVKIPASADASGTVNKTAKTVPIGFEGRGGGLTHNGSMVLSYP